MSRSKTDIINAMCMTFRHDYGLMEEKEKASLFRSMKQIFENDIERECMMQSDLDDYDERVDELEEELSKEKDLHALTRNRFKEAEEYIEKLKKDRDYWKKSFNKQVEASRNNTSTT